MSAVFRVALCSLICMGCAARATPPQAAQAPAATGVPNPERVVLPRTVVTPNDAASINELYDRASAELNTGSAARAAADFDRVFALDPEGELAPDALFQAGVAHEQAGDREAALSRFEQLARRFPAHPLGREGLVRTVRLLAFLERWIRAAEAADLLLSRGRELRPFENVVAHSGKALGLVARGELDAASYHIEKGRNVIDAHGLDQAGRVARDLAQLYFALGEVRRIRAERIRFLPVPENFPAVLEQRCQLLLDAQSAYSDTMRAYDAHWSAMAGYRVGELYQKLHVDLMAVPPPKGADSEPRKQLFEGAMRLRYSILLRKALSMMEHTLAMAERTSERSAWVLRAHDAKSKIGQAIMAEDRAIDRLPYTREQLQAALDDLAVKAASKRSTK
jgi:tetratricopeptide (TPR) repeat protein